MSESRSYLLLVYFLYHLTVLMAHRTSYRRRSELKLHPLYEVLYQQFLKVCLLLLEKVCVAHMTEWVCCGS